MNEEILAGIKTAIEHGFSLEEAANSFVNAGNNPADVREAASYVLRGVSPLPVLSKSTEIDVKKELIFEKKPEASKNLKKILILLSLLVVLALVLSFLLFKDKLLSGFLTAVDSIFP